MLQNGHSNGFDPRENQPENYLPLAQIDVLQQDVPFIDPAILTPVEPGIVFSGLHIVLMCSAYDDDSDEE